MVPVVGLVSWSVTVWFALKPVPVVWMMLLLSGEAVSVEVPVRVISLVAVACEVVAFRL